MLGLAVQVKDQAARFGTGRAARYLAWRLADRIAGCTPYVGLVLASLAHSRNGAVPEGFSCREVALHELAPYALDSAYDLSERFLSEARARQDSCIGVFAGERLVSYSFNSRTPTDIDAQFRYQFPRGWVYHFKAFTHPEWRGQRLHGCQISHVFDKFASTPGFQGLTTLVAGTNYRSLASFSRLRFEPLFRFAIVGKGRARRVLYRRGQALERANGLAICGQVNGEAFGVAKIG